VLSTLEQAKRSFAEKEQDRLRPVLQNQLSLMSEAQYRIELPLTNQVFATVEAATTRHPLLLTNASRLPDFLPFSQWKSALHTR